MLDLKQKFNINTPETIDMNLKNKHCNTINLKYCVSTFKTRSYSTTDYSKTLEPKNVSRKEIP